MATALCTDKDMGSCRVQSCAHVRGWREKRKASAQGNRTLNVMLTPGQFGNSGGRWGGGGEQDCDERNRNELSLSVPWPKEGSVRGLC
jgi:hypothetical protein